LEEFLGLFNITVDPIGIGEQLTSDIEGRRFDELRRLPIELEQGLDFTPKLLLT
jgi:hypothetical protein